MRLKIKLASLLFLLIAGCSTPRHPATVATLPPAPPVTLPATNTIPSDIARLIPPGAVPMPRGLVTVQGFDQPATVIIPSLATIALLPGYANLQWDIDTDPSVDAYAIYYGNATRQYTNQIMLGNMTNCTVPNLIVGAEYHFALTALCSTNGLESDFSDEAIVAKLWQVAEIDFGPGDTNTALESSPDLFNWAPRSDSRLTTNNTWRVKLYDELPAEFFRSVTYPAQTNLP